MLWYSVSSSLWVSCDCIPVPLSINESGCASFQAWSRQPCWATITDGWGNRSHFNSRHRASATKLKTRTTLFLNELRTFVVDLCTLWRCNPYPRPRCSFTRVHTLTLSLRLCRFCPPFLNTCYDVYKIIQRLFPVRTSSARALFVFSVAVILH